MARVVRVDCGACVARKAYVSAMVKPEQSAVCHQGNNDGRDAKFGEDTKALHADQRARWTDVGDEQQTGYAQTHETRRQKPHAPGCDGRGENSAAEHRHYDADIERAFSEQRDERSCCGSGDGNLCGVHRSDCRARRDIAVEKVGGNHGAPCADQPVGAAADQTRDGDATVRMSVGHRIGPLNRWRRGLPESLQYPNPDDQQDHGKPGTQCLAVDVRQNVGADEATDAPGNRQSSNQLAVNVSQLPVRRARRHANHHLHQIDRGGTGLGRHAARQQDRRRRRPKPHAERPVDE